VTKKIPDMIKRIMQEIVVAGYSVFVVGGAVRDLMLGREPKDYDLTTDALPEEIVAVANRAGWKVVERLGQNFGVVAVVAYGEVVEIATFRGESYGVDSHRPEKVWKAETLEEDLSRRDFTCNAMALDLDGNVYDLFGGEEDIKAGLLRTVGVPDKRFAEDALRMFRACRFAAELGFAIDPAILQAIPGQVAKVGGLSLERVREEMRRILVAAWPSRGLEPLVMSGLASAQCRVKSARGVEVVPILPELVHLVDMPQNPRFHVYDVWRHTLKTVERVPQDLTLRWAALLHDVAKGLPGIRGIGEGGRLTDYGHDKAGAEMAEKILQRFGFSNEFRSRVVWLIARHMRVTITGDDRPVWRWLRGEARSGSFRKSCQLQEAFMQLGQLCIADMAATGTAQNLEIPRLFMLRIMEMTELMPVSTGDLHYRAEVIRDMLGDVRWIGPFLKNALGRVQDGMLENNEASLEEAARRWRKRQGGQNIPEGGQSLPTDNG